MDHHYVYLLQSKKNGSFYIGSSSNPHIRLIQHNTGRVKSTKYKGPWELIFSQSFSSAKKAKQIEYNLKSRKSKKLLEQIIKDQVIKFTESSLDD